MLAYSEKNKRRQARKNSSPNWKVLLQDKERVAREAARLKTRSDLLEKTSMA